MKFSKQLVISILGITILTQLVFGGVAYWIISDNHTESHNEILHYISETISANLVGVKKDSFSQKTLDTIHQQLAVKELVISITDSSGANFIAGNINTDSSSVISDLAKSVNKLAASEVNKGSLKMQGQKYFWLSSHVLNNQYHITLLKQDLVGGHQTNFRLGMRLLTTSIVIIWLAVWLALLLGKIISTKLQKKNEAIKYQALHDELTGLANRTLLFDRLEQTQLTSNRTKSSFALLLMDLDNFKEINDALGHHFGDLLLKALSQKIQLSLRGNDSMARLGGDEFAILLANTDKEGAINCAEKVLDNLKTPFEIKDIRIECSTSIGIAFYPEDGSTSEILLQRADIAMYQAKKTRNHYVVYDQSRDSNNVRNLTLTNELKTAIENDEIEVYYQPMVDQKTNRTIAAEALARWNHPELGFISPEEFIPMAERTGAIRRLTLSVLKRAMLDCKQWQNLGYDMMVAVNISTHCLQDHSFPEKLIQLLQDTGISAKSIELEITETALMQDLSRARQVLDKLHKTGFKLSIDDFGTGFSSLAYLKELPVDTLKIDKSFVFDMANNENDTAIIQTVIELAHNFNCKVIAEGVENKRTLKQLQTLGSDIAQGYLFSKPIPLEAFNQWLKNTEWEPLSLTAERKETKAEYN